MKKKLVALFLSLTLLLTALTPALAADEFDISNFRDEDLFDISVDADNEVAFITTNMSAGTRSFVHDLESDVRYSCFESDVLVLDYFSSQPYGILRTWIHYAADEYLYITNVSFIIGKQQYTFSGVADKEWWTQYDDGIMEDVLIMYGDTSDMVAFLLAVENEISQVREDDHYTPDVTLILHGTKDVTGTVGSGALLDLYVMTMGFLSANGDLADAIPTTLKVTTLE